MMKVPKSAFKVAACRVKSDFATGHYVLELWCGLDSQGKKTSYHREPALWIAEHANGNDKILRYSGRNLEQANTDYDKALAEVKRCAGIGVVEILRVFDIRRTQKQGA